MMIDANLDAQIERVREKLGQAHLLWQIVTGMSFPQAAIDPTRRYPFFGARKHGFTLKPPLLLALVEGWEEVYGVALPGEFRLFLTRLGHGGAGPYYGLLPLLEIAPTEVGRDLGQMRHWLTQTCVLREGLPQEGEAWLEEAAGSDWEARFNRDEWAPGHGALTIVEEGCCLETVLILNGPCRGRLCHLDWLQVPIFAPEAHFLDWYEVWLDDVFAAARKII